mgnify:CR=1 FL=1
MFIMYNQAQKFWIEWKKSSLGVRSPWFHLINFQLYFIADREKYQILMHFTPNAELLLLLQLKLVSKEL